VFSVSHRLTLRHLCEPIGGTEGLLETVGFKKTMEYVMKNKRECQMGASSNSNILFNSSGRVSKKRPEKNHSFATL